MAYTNPLGRGEKTRCGVPFESIFISAGMPLLADTVDSTHPLDVGRAYVIGTSKRLLPSTNTKCARSSGPSAPTKPEFPNWKLSEVATVAMSHAPPSHLAYRSDRVLVSTYATCGRSALSKPRIWPPTPRFNSIGDV